MRTGRLLVVFIVVFAGLTLPIMVMGGGNVSRSLATIGGVVYVLMMVAIYIVFHAMYGEITGSVSAFVRVPDGELVPMLDDGLRSAGVHFTKWGDFPGKIWRKVYVLDWEVRMHLVPAVEGTMVYVGPVTRDNALLVGDVKAVVEGVAESLG